MARLSPREQQAVDLIAKGARDRDIAREMGVAITTARTHVLTARHKLDASNRTHAAAEAYKRGLIS